MIGRVIGNYRVVEQIGRGGMGAVYRAVDQMTSREVAIKSLRSENASDPDAQARFQSEAKSLAKLNHPSIAMLYAFFREGDECFMVMEYVPGRNLEQVLRSAGAFSWQHAAGILLRALDGMRQAHTRGIVHRDLKPANIMLASDGAVKVMDFGIARAFDSPKLTRDSRLIGTVAYLSPERVLGQPADARSDVYALGLIYYEMVSGHLPFTATSEYEFMRAQAEGNIKPLSDWGVTLPDPVAVSLALALEKDPALRHPDAGAFADHLQEAVIASGGRIPDLAVVPPAETRAVELPQETVFIPLTAETAYVPAPAQTVFAAPVPPKETTAIRPLLDTSVTAAPPAKKPFHKAWLVPIAIGAVALAAISGALTVPRWKNRPQAPAQPPAIAVTAPAVEPPVTKPAPAPPKPDLGREKQPEPAKPVEPVAPAPAPPTIANLHDVKRLYLVPTETELDDVLRDEIASAAPHLKLAASVAQADAVMEVVIEDQKGHVLTGTAGRVIGIKGGKRALASIRDRSGSRLLWSADIDDRHSILNAMQNSARRLASRVAKRLGASLN